MAQQTAVEWLEKHLKNFPHIKHSKSFKDLIEQAKQMEKEQIMDARLSTFDLIRRDDVLNAEQYYNETYENPTHL